MDVQDKEKFLEKFKADIAENTDFITVRDNEVDHEVLTKFSKKHRHKGKYLGAIGGKFSYTITSTGLGQTIEITCNVCGAHENITNFDLW